MNYTTLLDQVKQHVRSFYKTHANDDILYHDIIHTEDVVAYASKLAAQYAFNEEDTFIVKTACWFHDTGYFTGPAAGHEERSAKEAASFLKSHGVSENIIQAVHNCIMATRMPQAPQGIVQQVVCDADLSHLATEDFSKRNNLLRKETAATQGRKISKPEWRKSTLAFLQGYHYHTEHGKNILQQGKQKNIERLKEKIAADEPLLPKPQPQTEPVQAIQAADEMPAAINITPAEPSARPDKKKSKNSEDKPGRGIETMFRISSNNHQRLSDMADNKAHIMITTTSIIISVLLSVLLRKLEEKRIPYHPVVLLLTVCVVTMVFCILATRPSIPQGTFTQQDIDEKKVNLLFFGNFYRMSLDEYAAGINKVMQDREFLYGSLTKDVYFQGLVLGKKYNLLRVGYNVFMFGIVASVLAFLIATIFFGH